MLETHNILTNTNFVLRRYLQRSCQNAPSTSHSKVSCLHSLTGCSSHTTLAPSALAASSSVYHHVTDYSGTFYFSFWSHTAVGWATVKSYTLRTSRCPLFVTYCSSSCKVATLVVTQIHTLRYSKQTCTGIHPNGYCQSRDKIIWQTSSFLREYAIKTVLFLLASCNNMFYAFKVTPLSVEPLTCSKILSSSISWSFKRPVTLVHVNHKLISLSPSCHLHTAYSYSYMSNVYLSIVSSYCSMPNVYFYTVCSYSSTSNVFL